MSDRAVDVPPGDVRTSSRTAPADARRRPGIGAAGGGRAPHFGRADPLRHPGLGQFPTGAHALRSGTWRIRLRFGARYRASRSDVPSASSIGRADRDVDDPGRRATPSRPTVNRFPRCDRDAPGPPCPFAWKRAVHREVVSGRLRRGRGRGWSRCGPAGRAPPGRRRGTAEPGADGCAAGSCRGVPLSRAAGAATHDQGTEIASRKHRALCRRPRILPVFWRGRRGSADRFGPNRARGRFVPQCTRRGYRPVRQQGAVRSPVLLSRRGRRSRVGVVGSVRSVEGPAV